MSEQQEQEEVKDLSHETNDPITGLAIHDVVIIDKKLRTDGGRSWGDGKYFGVVTQLSEEEVVIICPDLREETYEPNKEDKGYYYKISKGSEVEYLKQIKQEVESQEKARAAALEKMKKLADWYQTFKFDISMLGRMGSFIKSFINK